MTAQQLIDKLNVIKDKSLLVYRGDYTVCDNFLIGNITEILNDEEYGNYILLLDKN
jgi:hypothetical protein